MDEIGLYDCSVVQPAVLLDRHGFQFGLNFLSYVNEEATRLFILIRVPYGIAKWQVGDLR